VTSGLFWVAGQRQGQEYEGSDNDEINVNWNFDTVKSSDDVKMQVPDRIIVTGGLFRSQMLSPKSHFLSWFGLSTLRCVACVYIGLQGKRSMLGIRLCRVNFNLELLHCLLILKPFVFRYSLLNNIFIL